MASRLYILYAAVAVALALALVAPEIPVGTSAATLRVVYDRSASMQRYDSALLASAVARALDRLPADSRAELIEFSATPEVTVPASPWSAQTRNAWQQSLTRASGGTNPLTQTSNLERALHAALAPNSETQPVVLLVSDGIQTHGNATTPLHAAKDSAIPVFYLLPSIAAGSDAWIADLTHATVARVGDRINVTATIHASVDGDAQIVLLAEHRTIATQAVHLRAGEPSPITLQYVPERAGPAHISLRVILPNDAFPDNDSVDSALDVLGLPRLTYVSQAAPSLLAQSLRKGGFELVWVKPAEAGMAIAASTANDVIVLDDVAAHDLAPATLEAMARTVGERGTGLVVLGGPHAFGNGGYRHSKLEALLPVTSESGLPRPKAAVLFVVDKSGSMESDPSQTSRLALAQRAVAETAKSLAPNDLVGLLAFDVNTHWLLPLASTADPGRAVAGAATNMRANGGTQLRRAVQKGIEALAGNEAEPRLLVLVTDGFSENERFDDLAAVLREKKIVLVALAVGADAETAPLQPLAKASGGSVLHIADALRLPRIMRQEVDRQRQASELGRSQPEAVSPLPFLPADSAWPEIGGYNIAKIKAETTLYLQAPRGDPLLATHFFGAGRVVALTAGLGAWSPTWPRWEHWPRFAGGLIQWAAGTADDTLFHTKLADGSNEILIAADVMAADSTWYTDAIGEARVTAPDGQLQTVKLLPVAPGRYQARAEATTPGSYVVSLQIGPYSSVRHIAHRTPQEFANPRVGTDQIHAWEQQRLIQPWSEKALQASLPAASISTRPVFLICAGLLYLLLIAIQRGWLSRFHGFRSIIRKRD